MEFITGAFIGYILATVVDLIVIWFDKRKAQKKLKEDLENACKGSRD